MPTLRSYQQEMDDAIIEQWRQGARNVCAVAPTGSGKTVLFAHRLHEHSKQSGIGVAIAHRQELVSQISLALAREELPHRIVGSKALISDCASLHLAEVGRSYISPRAQSIVAGVDTLIRRDEPWFGQTTLWVMDETHHLLRENKWGKAIELFPNARGLGVTATSGRADGQGLGRHADGVMDALVEGPTMRYLIDQGFLSDYRVIAPPAPHLHLEDVPITAAGDYNAVMLAKAVHNSQIVGDAVQHYKKWANGKLGVTFCVDVKAANETADAFRQAGVPAEVVHAKTPVLLRASILRRFRQREILQLVNVDLFGEGFDLPAIEVVSMLRPTTSFPLFCQQFGRALRPMDGKDKALILDHVGNIYRHGAPDAPRDYSLDRREKRAGNRTDVMPLRNCPDCLGVYEKYLLTCPYCDYRPEPAARSSIEQVDGDLTELTPDALAMLGVEKRKVDGMPRMPANATPVIAASVKKNHRERQEAQAILRESMMLWGGKQTADGLQLREAQRRFYLTFGVDVLSAQGLGRPEAEALNEKVRRQL